MMRSEKSLGLCEYLSFALSKMKAMGGFLSRRLTDDLHVTQASLWRLTVGTPSTEAKKPFGR